MQLFQPLIRILHNKKSHDFFIPNMLRKFLTENLVLLCLIKKIVYKFLLFRSLFCLSENLFSF